MLLIFFKIASPSFLFLLLRDIKNLKLNILCTSGHNTDFYPTYVEENLFHSNADIPLILKSICTHHHMHDEKSFTSSVETHYGKEEKKKCQDEAQLNSKTSLHFGNWCSLFVLTHKVN